MRLLKTHNGHIAFAGDVAFAKDMLTFMLRLCCQFSRHYIAPDFHDFRHDAAFFLFRRRYATLFISAMAIFAILSLMPPHAHAADI